MVCYGLLLVGRSVWRLELKFSCFLCLLVINGLDLIIFQHHNKNCLSVGLITSLGVTATWATWTVLCQMYIVLILRVCVHSARARERLNPNEFSVKTRFAT